MEFLLRNSSYNETLTYLIISSIIIITCVKLIYTIQFNDFIGALTNSKYFLLHNKGDKKSNLFNHLFYLFFTINLSVFLYVALVSLDISPPNNTYLLIISFVITNIYFIIKYLIEKIIFEILDLNAAFENFNFQRLTFINFIGLLLLFLNIVILYISPNPTAFMTYIYLGVLFFTYTLSIIIIVLYNQKIILKHWFYFILYLCALEISPFLIGGVLVLTNILK
jgi:hypothetical protein